MNALYSIDAIRTIERSALADLPKGTLMQRAGSEAASLAMHMLAKSADTKKEVLVLAGPGNNGGDALEMATILANDGVAVSVLLKPEKTVRRSHSRQKKSRQEPCALGRRPFAQNDTGEYPFKKMGARCRWHVRHRTERSPDRQPAKTGRNRQYIQMSDTGP